MKLLVLFLLSTATASATQYVGPILYKVLGGLDRDKGVTKTEVCNVYADYKGVDKKVFDAIKIAAGRKWERVGVHIRREVPSVQYFAVNVVSVPTIKLHDLKAVPVILFQDSSDLRMRKGQETRDLIRLIDRACK